MTAPFVAQKALFKAYDIRGELALFTPQFIHALAYSFGKYYHHQGIKMVVVGHDTRVASVAIAHAICQALCHVGIQVYWLGLVSTPLMVFWANRLGGSGVIATASHSPKHISGVKWLTCYQSPSRDDIAWLYQHLPSGVVHLTNDTNCPSCELIPIQPPDIVQTYANALHAIINKHTQDKLANKLVIDCLDGASSVVVRAVFSPWVDELIVLNDRTDGQFDKGNPDPSEPNRLQELSQAVICHKADMGFAFDGDGDRLAVVDSAGQVLGFDELLCLLALASLGDNQKCQNVLFDVKCLHTLPKLLHEYSQGRLIATMTKTGSSHLRRQAMAEGAWFAGELSGHFIFNDGQFTGHDDGVYAAMRLLLWLTTQPMSLHSWYQHMPKPVATPDLYLALTDGYHTPHQLVDKLSGYIKQQLQDKPKLFVQTIDGIRLDYCPDNQVATAFGLIRASNTSNSFTIRFAGDGLVEFIQMVDCFVDLMTDCIKQSDEPTVKHDLADFLAIFQQTLHQNMQNLPTKTF